MTLCAWSHAHETNFNIVHTNNTVCVRAVRICDLSENQEARASRAASRCAISSIFRRIASMGDRSSTELVSAKTSAGALPIASSSSKAERKPAYASCAPPSLRMTSSVACCGVARERRVSGA